MKITIHQKKPVILDSFREKTELTTKADITILLDSKNEIVIRTDEQGDHIMIQVGDTVVFLYVKPNDMGGITLHKETGLKVEEITEEWDRGRKILMARVGRTKYALEFLRKVKK